MKILILGASGYAGACIKKVLKKGFESVLGTYRTWKEEYRADSTMLQLELGDDRRLREVLNQCRPNVVISCVTGDFSQQMEAHKLVAEYLAAQGEGKLIYLSTANVFDGALEAPHFEQDAPKAASPYGKFKIACETCIRDRLGERCVIVRIPEIWGRGCPRLRKLLRAVQEGTPIQSYGNLFVNYTTNAQIAQWIAFFLERDLRGVFHIGTRDLREYTAFLRELLQALGLQPPAFQVEECGGPLYQAVLPSRKDIPDYLQFDVADVIAYLVENRPAVG